MNYCFLFFPLWWIIILHQIVGTASVIDGDTLEVRGQRIRLYGVDAPESSQWCTDQSGAAVRCGQQAAMALDSLLNGQTCRCEVVDTDRYGRLVATCYVGQTNVNAWLVRQGWALAYRKYSQDYAAAEQLAQVEGRGIWQYAFKEPWEYRASRRPGRTASTVADPAGFMPDPPWTRRDAARSLSGVSTNSDGTSQTIPVDPSNKSLQSQPSDPCTIKGNINRHGERIYHTPASRWYERTIVDESKGERWFCTEEQARLAGWRGAAN